MLFGNCVTSASGDGGRLVDLLLQAVSDPTPIAIVVLASVLLFRALPRVLDASMRMTMALVVVFGGSNERAARALQVLDRTGPGTSSVDLIRRGNRPGRPPR